MKQIRQGILISKEYNIPAFEARESRGGPEHSIYDFMMRLLKYFVPTKRLFQWVVKRSSAQ